MNIYKYTKRQESSCDDGHGSPELVIGPLGANSQVNAGLRYMTPGPLRGVSRIMIQEDGFTGRSCQFVEIFYKRPLLFPQVDTSLLLDSLDFPSLYLLSDFLSSLFCYFHFSVTGSQRTHFF